MINLIPPAARHSLHREYWLRVLTIWFLLVGFAAIVVIILKAPTVMLLIGQSVEYSEAMTQATKVQATSELSEASIEMANTKAVQLNQGTDSTKFSQILRDLEGLAGSGISIQEFTMNRIDGGLRNILITGTAQSRSALTTFSDAVEAHPFFTEATLPIANLAQDRDINFSITITTIEAVDESEDKS